MYTAHSDITAEVFYTVVRVVDVGSDAFNDLRHQLVIAGTDLDFFVIVTYFGGIFVLDGLPGADGLGYRTLEKLRGDRFGEISVSAAFRASLDALFVGPGCQDDDRDEVRARIMLDFLAEFGTLCLRLHDKIPELVVPMMMLPVLLSSANTVASTVSDNSLSAGDHSPLTGAELFQSSALIPPNSEPIHSNPLES